MVGEGADEYTVDIKDVVLLSKFYEFQQSRVFKFFLGLSSEFMQNDIKNILENYINFKKKN